MIDRSELHRTIFCCKNELVHFNINEDFSQGMSIVYRLCVMSDFIVQKSDFGIYTIIKNRAYGNTESKYLNFEDAYLFMRDNFKKVYFGIPSPLSPKVKVISTLDELMMFIKISEF